MKNEADIRESGLLEQYALGRATPAETAEVHAALERYPALRDELASLEQTLEQYATLHAINPPVGLRDRVLAAINADNSTSHTPAVPARRPAVVRTLRLALAAAATVAAIAVVSALLFYRQNVDLRAEIGRLSRQLAASEQLGERLAVSQEQLEQQQNFLLSPDLNRVVMGGLDPAPDARAVVYADARTERAYLQVVNLPVPPAGKQYQLWGIAGGQPVSMGVFNLPMGSQELQVVPNVPDAQAYAVTLEPTGGSETPTLEQMYVMGEL